MNKNLLIFDIETVPCLETARRLLHLGDSIPDNIAHQKIIEYHLNITKGQNDFLRQPFHKVLCISFLLCEIEYTQEGENYLIKKIQTGGRHGETEEEILEKFYEFLGKYKPRLVSFNGKTFDLPVIQYRLMKYKIPSPWLHSKDILYKFNNHEPHCDLIDAFSNFGSSAKVRMAEVAALLGIPCKETGSGDEVFSMYKEGKIQEICNYCEEDVGVTYMLYLYYQMHRGSVGKRIFENLLSDFMEKTITTKENNIMSS